jgi:type II secretory pathway pseudopilin PulG
MLKIRKTTREAEQGFVLVGLIVAIFLILLVLGVAAPRVAKELRRDRELEAVHRGNQYVRAVQVYYRKNTHYPASIEQLEKTNNVRYLRQRYADPMTGKPDWKLIHVGEAKTTVKGFFGQPLSGLTGGAPGNSTGTGSGGSVGPGGTAGAGAPGAGASSFGSSSFGSNSGSSSSGSSFGSSAFGSSSPSSSGGTTGATGTGSGAAGGVGSPTTDSTGISSQSASSVTGTGAPIMGVGSAATGNSIVVLNEQTTYPTWEFIYDPRIEQLKAKASLMGGAPSSVNASNLGSNPTGSGTPGAPGSNGTGSSAPGSSGSSPSVFGGGSSSFGSSGSTNQAPSTTP